MSNKNAATTKAETAVTVTSFHPVNDVPDKAPAPSMDLSNPHLSFDDVLPANYFSMERVQEWLGERGAESRVLTVTGASVEFVYDPEKGVDTGEWKPCLSFEDTATMLVINVSRGKQLKKMTGSPFLRDWAKIGRIAIRPGIADGKAQIVIGHVPIVASDDELNEALFN